MSHSFSPYPILIEVELLSFLYPSGFQSTLRLHCLQDAAFFGEVQPTVSAAEAQATVQAIIALTDGTFDAAYGGVARAAGVTGVAEKDVAPTTMERAVELLKSMPRQDMLAVVKDLSSNDLSVVDILVEDKLARLSPRSLLMMEMILP